jgi:hypothetical protein
VAALLVEHVPRDRHQVRPLRLRRVVHPRSPLSSCLLPSADKRSDQPRIAVPLPERASLRVLGSGVGREPGGEAG